MSGDWKCQCGWSNLDEWAECEGCGAARPLCTEGEERLLRAVAAMLAHENTAGEDYSYERILKAGMDALRGPRP